MESFELQAILPAAVDCICQLLMFCLDSPWSDKTSGTKHKLQDRNLDLIVVRKH